jgi:aryl sulfotransferase
MPELLRAPERVVHTPATDSRRWNKFAPRDGDIVIATHSKCGTTWTQRIVDMLVFQSPDVRPFGEISPWLDSTIFNPLETDLATLDAQKHRRYIKSHLSFDALPVWDTVKYIHVGRDGRDARLSWQNHQAGFKPEAIARIVAQAAALAKETGAAPAPAPQADPNEQPREYLLHWLDELEAALSAQNKAGVGMMGSDFFSFEATFWRERQRPNLLLVHYDDLQKDLAGEMRRISDYLGIATPDSLMPRLVEAARFNAMKKDGDALVPKLKESFDRGADRFLNQGKTGRWREYLQPADVARYEAIVKRAATPGFAHWLEGGRSVAGDPRASRD